MTSPPDEPIYGPPSFEPASLPQQPNLQTAHGPPPAYGTPPAYGPPPAYPMTPGSPVPPPRVSLRPPFPHPEPRPYHLMYRTWTYAWWRPVVGIVLLLLGMTIVVPLVTVPVLLVGALVEGGGQGVADAFEGLGTLTAVTPASLLYLNLSLGGVILWTWGLIRVLHQMRPRWLSSVVPKLRWRFLMVCLGLALIAVLAQFVAGLVVPQDATPDVTVAINPLNGTTVGLLVVMVLTTPLQAAGEEYAFRGYLLQALGALAGNRWVTITLTALLFAVAHLQFSPPLFLDRFLFGLIAAWLVIRTGGLEAAIALHVLNNYVALTFGILFADLSEALDPQDVSWWNLPVSLTQSLVYAGLVAWVAGRMKVQDRTRPPSDASSPGTTSTPGATALVEPSNQSPGAMPEAARLRS